MGSLSQRKKQVLHMVEVLVHWGDEEIVVQ
jgi:hypothetical protein